MDVAAFFDTRVIMTVPAQQTAVQTGAKRQRCSAGYSRASEQKQQHRTISRRVKSRRHPTSPPQSSLFLRENVIQMGTICDTRLVSSTGSPYCSKYFQEYLGKGLPSVHLTYGH